MFRGRNPREGKGSGSLKQSGNGNVSGGGWSVQSPPNKRRKRKMAYEEKYYDWIISDIFRKVKIEIKAKNFDDAIRAARNAYQNFS